MKAITICQPYAHLIVIGKKWVENRTWPTSFRGQLLIHAGKSKDWLEADFSTMAGYPAKLQYGEPLQDMAFGAIVGVAEMTACLARKTIEAYAAKDPRWKPLADHEHTEGPWCFVMRNVHRFADPIPYRGELGFFDVPDELVRRAIEESTHQASSDMGGREGGKS